MADEKTEAPKQEEKEGGSVGGQATQSQQGAQQGAQQQQANRVQVDESNAVCAYANFCRVTGTPEELIIDFGLNSQPFGTPTEPVKVSQRIVTNYYTAKRMLHALHLSVQRHEPAFGVLETDVQNRVVAPPKPSE